MQRFLLMIFIYCMASTLHAITYQFSMKFGSKNYSFNQPIVFKGDSVWISFDTNKTSAGINDISEKVLSNIYDKIHFTDSIAKALAVSIEDTISNSTKSKDTATIAFLVNISKPFEKTLQYKILVKVGSKPRFVIDDTKDTVGDAAQIKSYKDIPEKIITEIMSEISRWSYPQIRIDYAKFQSIVPQTTKTNCGKLIMISDSIVSSDLIEDDLFAIIFGEVGGRIVFDSSGNRVPVIRKMKLKSIKLNINSGAIQHAVVIGNFNGDLVYFKNTFIIPISNTDDIWNFNNNTSYRTIMEARLPDGTRVYAYLSDMLFYEPHINITGNYVTDNISVELNSDSLERQIILYKRNFADDFDIRIYSDVTGFGKENPNGILQTEAKYPFILNSGELGTQGFITRIIPVYVTYGVSLALLTSPHDSLSHTDFIPIFFSIAIPTILAYITPTIISGSVTPFVNFTRIEDRLNYIAPYAYNGTTSYSYVNSFDLLKYSNLNIGLELNLLESRIGNASVKSSLLAGAYR